MVNARIILIGYRAKILNEISNLTSDTSRSLTDFSNALYFSVCRIKQETCGKSYRAIKRHQLTLCE